jgi:patatin-like phospholipase/acyl hydrolase
MAATSPAARLRLLSLDGGGCRGMIQLLLLRHLLENLEPNTDDVDALRPCDYFDVIAGTSAGGLNALMLGRLEFSIGEAIQAFSKFTETVFKESGGMKKALKEGHMFLLARLEEAVAHARIQPVLDQYLVGFQCGYAGHGANLGAP